MFSLCALKVPTKYVCFLKGEPGFLGPQGEPGLPGLPGTKVRANVLLNPKKHATLSSSNKKSITSLLDVCCWPWTLCGWLELVS